MEQLLQSMDVKANRIIKILVGYTQAWPENARCEWWRNECEGVKGFEWLEKRSGRRPAGRLSRQTCQYGKWYTLDFFMGVTNTRSM